MCCRAQLLMLKLSLLSGQPNVLVVAYLLTISLMLLSVVNLFIKNINFLLQIPTTLPVTTASAERIFSTLRRLKMWLRSSMNDESLTGLALLAVPTDISFKPEAVVDNFLKQGKRRIAKPYLKCHGIC